MKLKDFILEDFAKSAFLVFCFGYFVINSILDILSSDWVVNLIEHSFQWRYGEIISIVKSSLTLIVLILFLFCGIKL